MDGERRCGGSAFQTAGIATWKLRRPNCVLVKGTSMKTCPARDASDWDADVVKVGRTVLTDTVKCRGCYFKLYSLWHWEPMKNVAKSQHDVFSEPSEVDGRLVTRCHTECHCSNQLDWWWMQQPGFTNNNNPPLTASFQDNVGKLAPKCHHSGILLEVRMRWWSIGGGVDNWSYKTSKFPVKSSQPIYQHPTLYRPHVLPVTKLTVTEHWRQKANKLPKFTETKIKSFMQHI